METLEPGWKTMERLRLISMPAFVQPRLLSIYAGMGEIRADGDYAQFGVYRGHTARVIAALTDRGRKLHLFDSFEGLPEPWLNKRTGHFKLKPNQIPQFDPDVAIIHKGWFKDTVPVFAKEHTQPLAFIHMDADLYSSTIDVLFNINDIIVKDTVIVFDEYANEEKNMDDEHRAFMEWMKKFDRQCDYLWRTERSKICVRITR